MLVLRRATAIVTMLIVTMLVTFLLVLTESGFACSVGAMSGMTAVSAGPAADLGSMADMAMPDAPSDAGNERAPRQAPCRLPWAPNGCGDMATCTPAALTAVTALPADPAPAPTADVVARVKAPVTVETPPELPPPRA